MSLGTRDDEMTETTEKTTAEKIADRFDNDGQRWERDGVDIDDVCREHAVPHARPEYRDGWGTDTYRWVFADGSVLTMAGAAWDFGYPDCWCWRGAGHTDDCPAAVENDETGESTTVWVDGRRDDAVTVARSVTDLDEAARLLGYGDYAELHAAEGDGTDESPLNFRHERAAELTDDDLPTASW
jgi:hypothetical protein